MQGQSLFGHQKIALSFHKDHRESFDLSEVGVGKTAPMILALESLSISPVLIITPNSILDNWKNETTSWSNLSCVILRGSRAYRLELLQQNSDFFIINYEGVRVVFSELMNKNFEAIILDEAHHIKNPKAKVTKCILQLAKQATVRKVMTGTLLTNDLQDVWSIAQFVSPNIFKANFWGFRNSFLEDKNAGKPWMKFPDWQPREGAAEQVRKRLEPYAIRFEKREVLKFLPPVLFERRSVEMSPEQRKVYNELKKEFLAELDSGEVILAPQILTRILKMIEVTSGFIYRGKDDTFHGAPIPWDTDQSEKGNYFPGEDPGRDLRKLVPTAYHFKQNSKLEVLKEVLDEIGNHRVVIWAAFREDVAIIDNLLRDKSRWPGTNVAIITGETPSKDRQPIVDVFNNGDVPYLICNPSCAGEGLTILAPYAIYYSRSWKLGERLQSLGRHDRPGAEQFDNITVIDLVCEGTIDAEILAALERKEDLLKSVNPKQARAML